LCRDEPLHNRVCRGGSWNNNPKNVRAANRNNNNPTNRNNNLGFRVASTPVGECSAAYEGQEGAAVSRFVPAANA
jgi:hypothetical protein